MPARHSPARPSTSILVLLATGLLLAAPPASDPAFAQGRGRGQARIEAGDRGTRTAAPGRQVPRGYDEPAFARGYDDGYARGTADGRSGQRYDPADSREYRDGDSGYEENYGSREAYRSNYRAGFRQGYESGYREATR